MSGWKGRLFLLLLLLLPPSGYGVWALGRPVKVEIAVIGKADVKACLTFHGILAARRAALLSSHVGGRVLEVRAQEGEVVRRGQVLARVGQDAWEVREKALELELATARDDVEKARENVRRHEEAFLAGEITATQLKQVQLFHHLAEIRNIRAERALRQLRAQIGEGTVVAPADGVLIKCYVSRGDRANRQPLFALAEAGAFLVRFYLPSEATLSVGQPAEIEPMGWEGPPLSAIVGGVSDGSGFKSGWANLDGERSLSEGRLSRVTVQTGTRRALVLPSKAIQASPEGPKIFLVVQDRVHLVSVRLGDESGTLVEVRGLPEGARVAVSGERPLWDGARVRIEKTERTE